MFPRMRKEWLWIWTCLSGAFSFNLDVAHPIILDHTKKGEYFGQDVKLTHELPGEGDDPLRTSYVIVGAPFAKAQLDHWKKFNTTGQVYRCRLDTENPGECEPYHIAVPKLEYSYYKDSKGKNPPHDKQKDGFHDMLFGSTITQDDPRTGQILVCGPRFKNIYGQAPTLGVCFAGEESANTSKEFKKISLVDEHFELVTKYGMIWDEKKKRNSSAFEFTATGYTQMGFSSHFVRNSSTGDILLGAPGANLWRGCLVIASYNDSTENYDARYVNASKNTLEFSYHGYSVTSGHYRNKNELLYVLGAPRSNSQGGSIAFMKPYDGEEQAPILKRISFGAVGGGFGSSLLTGDFNNDGFDDLLVGAPATNLGLPQSYDEGKVYLFQGHIFSFFNAPKELIGGSASQGRFGTSMTSLGDINRDKYPDVAIAAPFESGGVGSVYVYYGSEDGLSDAYVQRIRGKDFQQTGIHLKGFGFGLGGAVDIDRNGYADLAVGAFNSGNVVILRSSPVIRFILTLKQDASVTAKEDAKFNLTACGQYEADVDLDLVCVKLTLKTEVGYMRAPRVVLFRGNEKVDQIFIYQTEFRRELSCENFTGVVQYSSTNRQFDENTPLKFSLEAELGKRLEDQSCTSDPPIKFKPGENAVILPSGDSLGMKKFCKTCPVVDPSKKSFVTSTSAFSWGCRNTLCECDLAVRAEFTDTPSLRVIGNLTAARLVVIITNHEDEPAISSVLKITWTRRVPLYRPLEDSTDDSNLTHHVRSVTLRSPFGNMTEKLEVNFDVSKMDSDLSKLVVKLEVETSQLNKDTDVTNNVYFPEMEMKSEFDIQVKGRPEAKFLGFYNTKKETEYIPFSDIYKISKDGPSPIKQLSVNLQIPIRVRSASGNSIRVDSVASVDSKRGRCNYTSHGGSERVIQTTTPSSNSTGGFDYDEGAEHESKTTPATTKKPDLLDREGSRRVRREVTKDDKSCPADAYCFSCNDATECITYQCTFESIEEQVSFSIEIQGGFNAYNMKNVLENVGSVVIKTTAEAIIVSPQGVQQTGNSPDKGWNTSKTTRVDLALPSWVVPVSVVAGILLLIILTTILYKVGFFKRKKIPSDNEDDPLEKQEEESGYHDGTAIENF